MGEVVSLEERKPHMTGKAICIACHHEWVATTPVGIIWFECPSCHTEKGTYINYCRPPERIEKTWTCNCGNQLFHATKEGLFCPNCGEWQHGF